MREILKDYTVKEKNKTGESSLSNKGIGKTGENRVVRPLCVCSQVTAGARGGKGSVVCPKCFVFSSLS